MKRSSILAFVLVGTLVAFGILRYRNIASTREASTSQGIRHATFQSKKTKSITAAAMPLGTVNLADLARELDGMPQSDRLEKLQSDRLEKLKRALGLFRSLNPEAFSAYLTEIAALDTSAGNKRILLDALFQAWGEMAPQDALAAAEKRTSDDLKSALVGWAVNDMNAPWEWVVNHPGMTPIMGTPKANYMEALIPVMADHGQLDALAGLVNRIPEKAAREFALMFFATATARQFPEFVERWLRELPSQDVDMPAGMVGTNLAKAGIDSVQDFVSRQDSAIQGPIIRGAVSYWARNGQSDTVLEFVQRYPGGDDASDDKLLSTVGMAVMLTNPEASLQVINRILDPSARDESLAGAASFLTGSNPAQALRFAMGISDESRREKRLLALVTTVATRRPTEARLLIEGSTLPEPAKNKLREAIVATP